MSQPMLRPVLPFISDALKASQVGVWETDFGSDTTRADATCAEIFGNDPTEAANGLPMSAWLRNVFHEDRLTLDERLAEVRMFGGMFVIEYRTQPAPSDIRWVLVRGRYERDHTGRVTGRGIIIDITESKLAGQAEERAFFVAPLEEGPSLDRLAAIALDARREIDDLGEREGSPLRMAIDALLWTVGQALAKVRSKLNPFKRKLN